MIPLREVEALAAQVANRLFTNRAEREDCRQELVLKALGLQDDPRMDQGAFVNTVLKREGIDLFDKTARRWHLSTDDAIPGDEDGTTYADALKDPRSLDFARRLETYDEARQVLDAIQARNPRYALAVRMRAEGHQTTAIGQALGVTATRGLEIVKTAQGWANAETGRLAA